MNLNGLFFNNEFAIEVKKKVQKGADILFPKIRSSGLKNKHQKIKSIISSDNDINIPSSNKRHLSLVTKTDFFSANPKDLMTGKVKNIQEREPIASSKFKKARPMKNFTVALDKCIDVQPERLLTQTKKHITSFRQTFMIQKGQKKIDSTELGSGLTSKNDKKSIGNYFINKQLGHGGFAKVFEVFHKQTSIKYAMKEYVLAESLQCYQKQYKVGEFFFKDGKIKNQFSSLPGAQSIIRYIERIKNQKKGYIIQEIGGVNFSKLLSEIKGAFHNKQRVYEVKFLPFYEKIKDRKLFSSVMVQICQAIKLLNCNGFVHCDLKLQNILVEYNDNQSSIFPIVKVIDFGSTFQIAKGLPKITITPEYMPPQLLMQFDKNGLETPTLEYGKIDVWSIGCIMFQIFTGVPLWFKYKCKIVTNEISKVELGIFALTNRDYPKIIKRQQQLCEHVIKSIGFVSHEWEKYRGLLRKIFVMNPEKRIFLQEIINQLKNIQ